MRPATLPREEPLRERLLHVDPARASCTHHRVAELPALFAPGDLVILNDAATLPASLPVPGRDLELRLVRRGADDAQWTAIALGRGDFRIPTEERGAPPEIPPGARFDLGAGLVAEVTAVDPELRQLLEIRFNLSGAPLYGALYRQARAIQYAYLERELPLYAFQNRYAARPWALELPSAGHCLTWEILLALRARGVGVAHLTHAAGISSTGSAALDRRLPLPERYEISAATVRAIEEARARGGKIIAVGTTVVRALESNRAEHGRLVAGEGEACMVIGPGYRLKMVDGILSGMHEKGTSHFALLEAFAPRAILEDALEAAERAGYLQHEFGDTMLVLSSR